MFLALIVDSDISFSFIYLYNHKMKSYNFSIVNNGVLHNRFRPWWSI